MTKQVFSFGNLELSITDEDVRPVVLSSDAVSEIAEDTVLSQTANVHALAVEEVNTAMRSVHSFRQLSQGLEAVMVEVEAVENHSNPTKEELDVIRIAASAVIRDGLSESDEAVIDNLIEGNLVGSQEGLLDVISNVAKKISFTAGNIAEKIGQAFSSLEGAAKLIESAQRLREKINGYNVETYTATFDGSMIDRIAVDGKMSIIKDLETIFVGFDEWISKPAKTAPATLNTVISIIEKALDSSDEEEFKKNYEAIKSFELPKSKSAKLIDSVKTRNGVSDIYAEQPIAAGWQKAYMVPRSSTDSGSSPHDKAVDHAYQLANYEVAVVRLKGNRKFTPTEVKLSKAEVLKVVDIAEKIGQDLIEWTKTRGTMTAMNKTFGRAAGKLSDFEKKPWVSRRTAAEARILLYSALSIFSYTFVNGWCIYSGGLTAKDAVTKLIYGTDLSGSKE